MKHFAVHLLKEFGQKGERQPLNNAQSKNQPQSSDNELKEFSDATPKRQRGKGPKIKVLFKTSDLQLN